MEASARAPTPALEPIIAASAPAGAAPSQEKALRYAQVSGEDAPPSELSEAAPQFLQEKPSLQSIPSTAAPAPNPAPAMESVLSDALVNDQLDEAENPEEGGRDVFANDAHHGGEAVPLVAATEVSDAVQEQADDSNASRETQLIRDFANHPMMDRVQRTLVETLQRELERIELEAREKLHAVKVEKRRREDLGVELYGTQQQLAKLQLSLEAAHNRAVELEEARATAEVKAQRVRSDHSNLKSALSERKSHVCKNQAELDAINETLRQVERYNEEMQKEIAVTKRATYKAEEDVTSLENAKRDQDFFIDTMQERIKRLEEVIAVHESQLERQRAESKEAKLMLSETGKEMELIVFEKRQLVQHWKASLVQLARRDEALSAAKATLASARMNVRDLQTEIDGARREISSTQTEYEGLVMACEKYKRDEAVLNEDIRHIAAECEAQSAQYALLQRSMAHTEEEEAKIAAECKRRCDSIEQLSANIQIVTVERQKIEQQVAAARTAQRTVSKAVKTIHKQTAAVKERAFEKEIEKAQVENELARIRVDAINTGAHNDQLRETLEEMVKKLKDQDTLIATYQKEIRQRNDTIEKKMLRVDRLNRKYEKMTAFLEEGEHLGPLEATIKNLTKDRDAVNAEAQAMQSQWLADQTRLVHTAQATEETLEKNAELRAHIRILDERHLQLVKEAATRASQINALNSNSKSLRADVARLNDMLGRHATMEQNLGNETSLMEMEFKSELKELEEESLKAEQKVVNIRAAKAQLLKEVMEVEEQVLLWEKKIQLERETQAALDPEIGSNEVKAMEKEIHRMKLRLRGLQVEQESMIQDMERAILKKEDYAFRFRGAQRPSMIESKGKQHTKASLKKKMAHLRFMINQTANDASKLSDDMQSRQRDIQDLTINLSKATARYSELEREAARLQANINNLLYQKQRRSEMQNARDRTASRYLDLERGVSEIVSNDQAGSVEKQLAAASEQNNGIRFVISKLLGEFDYLTEPLERIMCLADDAIQPTITGVADFEMDGGER